jgi:hypothetical protein
MTDFEKAMVAEEPGLDGRGLHAIISQLCRREKP